METQNAISSKKERKTSHKGFTLVELVVTIAIIAILSTIGFASIG